LRPGPGRASPSLCWEWAAKACYLLPLAALASVLVILVRDARAGVDWNRWVELALAAAFAGGTYATMLYRADWAHLMNIYPAQILLVSLLVARWSRAARTARVGGVVILGAWFCFAGASAVALAVGERHPVETPRGTLYGSARSAEYVQRVLAHVAARPAAERIVFLPAVPLYYFLSTRPLALPVDLVVPGIVGPEEDRRIAAALAAADRVVYDPTRVPSVHRDIGEYAPETSALLARRFQWSEILAPNAYVLTQVSASDDVEPIVRLDPWAGQKEARRRWLFYRVLAIPAGPAGQRACVAFAHTPASGDWLSATPMFEPRMWSDERVGVFFAKPPPARMVVEVVDEAGAAAVLYVGRLSPGLPGPPLRLSLEAFTGHRIRLRLCASAFAGAAHARSPVGWADVRVLAPPAAPAVSGVSRRR